MNKDDTRQENELNISFAPRHHGRTRGWFREFLEAMLGDYEKMNRKERRKKR